MVAERAGYTVTMFLVDISKSMGATRTIDVDGGERTKTTTHLEWSLEYVKYKVQEMIFAGRKTDKCGVIVFGSTETDNIISKGDSGYENVTEYIPIDTPNAGTLAKLDQLEATDEVGDPIDALIVAIQTQDAFLGSKKTWTRKIAIVTDGQSPIETEDWELTVEKLNSLDIQLTVLGVDFDDDRLPFKEEDKPSTKIENENFYHSLTSTATNGVLGNLEYALQQLAYPDIKLVKSSMMSHVLRIGDVNVRPEEAIEIPVKVSKATMLARPKSWKKFAARPVDNKAESSGDTAYGQLAMRTEYFVDKNTQDRDGDLEDVKMEVDNDEKAELEVFEKEELVKGFKYGTTYVTCPDGQFEKLPSVQAGIDICGFFLESKFHREQAIGEIAYIWADPNSALQQVAISSIAQAMLKKKAMAIARWVTASGRDPKMGVLMPSMFEEVDCLVWVQMPFADDLRKYAFPPLKSLTNKKGDVLTEHPYIPTEEQLAAMDNFVDSMDLMDVGEKDEEGNRQPWFDPATSYNPAIHRVKQALFHSAIVPDLTANPIGPPHAELLKYFDPPKRAVKRSRDAIAELVSVMNVKAVPKKVARPRKDGHELSSGNGGEGLVFWDIAPQQAATSATVTKDANTSTTSAEKPLDGATLSASTPTKPSANVNSARGLPTPARSMSPVNVDPGREPGRLVGKTDPLRDFQAAIGTGKPPLQALEDLSFVVTEIVTSPFASRRHEEILRAMSQARSIALKEGGIDTWNKFIKTLRESCLKKPGNVRFWEEVKAKKPSVALISESEASPYHGASTVSDEAAATFLSS